MEVDTFKAQIEQILVLKQHVSSSVVKPGPQEGPLQTHKLLTTLSSCIAPRPAKHIKLNVTPLAGLSSSSHNIDLPVNESQKRTSKAGKAKKKGEDIDVKHADPSNLSDGKEKLVDDDETLHRASVTKGKQKKKPEDIKEDHVDEEDD